MVGAFTSMGVMADDNFQFVAVNTGYKNDIVPLQMKTKMNAVLKNATSDVKPAWSVNDTSVATINQDGVLTPLKEGQVKVTATALEDGQCVWVTIKKASLTIASDTKNDRLLPTESMQMFAQLSFDGLDSTYNVNVGSNYIAWATSTSNYLSVDANGKITPKSLGDTVITAYAKSNPSFAAQTLIHVVKGYIDLVIPSTNPSQPDLRQSDVPSINYAMEPKLFAYSHYVGSDDTVLWKCIENKATIKNLNTVNTAVHEYYSRILFTDSGKITIRASMKSDPSIYTDFVFNVTPSADALSADIDTATGYDSASYAVVPWNNLQIAIQKAKAILNNPNATQAQINAADTYLNQMMEQVDQTYIPPSDNTDGNYNETTDETNSSVSSDVSSESASSNISSSKKAQPAGQPKVITVTVINYPLMVGGIAAGVIVVAAGVVLLVLWKKKKKALAAAAGAGEVPIEDEKMNK